jgi:hypothetical protein
MARRQGFPVTTNHNNIISYKGRHALAIIITGTVIWIKWHKNSENRIPSSYAVYAYHIMNSANISNIMSLYNCIYIYIYIYIYTWHTYFPISLYPLFFLCDCSCYTHFTGAGQLVMFGRTRTVLTRENLGTDLCSSLKSIIIIIITQNMIYCKKQPGEKCTVFVGFQ